VANILLQITISIVLVLGLGLLIMRYGLRFQTSDRLLSLCAALPLGALGWAGIGLVIWNLPRAVQSWAWLFGIALVLAILLTRNLRSLLTIIKMPLLITCVFAAFVFAHFTPDELPSGVDPWALAKRTQTFNVPDHFLQWMISDNFVSRRRIERGFNPDGKQMWSAGDRPMLPGFLDAVLSVVSRDHNTNIYFSRLFFLGSFFIFPILGLLRSEFGVRSKLALSGILLCLLVHPFFFTNVFFTWPKIASVSFLLIGFYFLANLSSAFGRAHRAAFSVIIGAAFAAALLSHTSSAVGICLVLLYLALTRFKPIVAQLKVQPLVLMRYAGLGLATLIIPMLIHANFLAKHTNRTQLLERVQLCRGGSYAYVTPVIPLAQACREYYERVGIAGMIDDRRQSLRAAFIDGYALSAAKISAWRSESGSLKTLISDWNRDLLFDPVTSYGVTTFPLGLICLVLGCIKMRKHRFGLPRELVLFVCSGLALLGFGLMLAEFSEMRPHVIPISIPICLQIALLVMLYRLNSKVFAVYTGVNILASIILLTSRVEPLFGYQVPELALASLLILMLFPVLMLQSFPEDESSKKTA